MEYNQSCDVFGVGSIKIQLSDRSCKIIRDVGYIPYIKRNLLSLDVFDAASYSYKAQGRVLKIFKGV